MKAGGQIGIEGTLCHQSTWCCVPLSLSPTMTTEVAVNAVPINFNINNELTLLAWFFASLALKPQYQELDVCQRYSRYAQRLYVQCRHADSLYAFCSRRYG